MVPKVKSSVTQLFYKFLDNEINLKELEEWIYENPDLESLIEEDYYQFLIEFNYNKKSSKVEIQDFILNHLMSEKEFADWKVNKLLIEMEGDLLVDNLFDWIKRNPSFYLGKDLRFNQYWTKKKVEIFWSNPISEYIKDGVLFLHLGTFENSYVHFLVNEENEIWFENDIGGLQYFGGKNINEALKKLFVKDYYMIN